MCVQTFHMVNINVPASVGAPPLDTTFLLIVLVAVRQFFFSFALLWWSNESCAMITQSAFNTLIAYLFQTRGGTLVVFIYLYLWVKFWVVFLYCT